MPKVGREEDQTGGENLYILAGTLPTPAKQKNCVGFAGNVTLPCLPPNHKLFGPDRCAYELFSCCQKLLAANMLLQALS